MSKVDVLQVYFLKSSIPLSAKRIPLWKKKLEGLGGQVEQEFDSATVTHILVGTKLGNKFPKELRAKPVVYVQWLESCLSENTLLLTEKYLADLSEHARAGEDPFPQQVEMAFVGKDSQVSKIDSAPEQAAQPPMKRYEAWLGHWKDEYNKITNVIEFMLQARYSARDSKNERLVKLLNELQKFELAVQNEHSSIGDDPHDIINHKALQYARAASVTRACSFEITEESLQKHELPYVGASTKTILRHLLHSGTCPELEAFREGSVVTDSRGQARSETVGGDVKRLFKSLPGVGVGLARTWYDLGFRLGLPALWGARAGKWGGSLQQTYSRTFEDVVAADHAAQDNKSSPVGSQGAGKPWMTKNLRFALEVRPDLLEDCPQDDIQAMEEDLRSAFQSITGVAWQVWLVGGGRRSNASHDADFVVSNPDIDTEGTVSKLVDHLVKNGRLVPPSRGMCSLQVSRRFLSDDELHQSPGGSGPSNHNLLADRHDHLLGIYITRSGKHRRMDVIVSSWEELPFCTISWTGSKQYMRFMRQYAVLRNMHLNAHRMMAQDKSSWYKVPGERGPNDRAGRECWPSNWDTQRPVKTERDVFELLGLPWLEAWERNC